MAASSPSRGLATKIFAHDHNWVLHPNDREVDRRRPQDRPAGAVTKLFSDDAVGKYLAGSAWHCYSGSIAGHAERSMSTLHERFPERPIYCTEISAWRNASKRNGSATCSGVCAPTGSARSRTGRSVALEWNLVLDHKYGPTLRDDSLAVGLVTIHTDTYNSVKFEREYYAMAHVSKAARPGAVCVKTSVTEAGALDVAAFRLKTGRGLPRGVQSGQHGPVLRRRLRGDALRIHPAGQEHRHVPLGPPSHLEEDLVAVEEPQEAANGPRTRPAATSAAPAAWPVGHAAQEERGDRARNRRSCCRK